MAFSILTLFDPATWRILWSWAQADLGGLILVLGVGVLVVWAVHALIWRGMFRLIGRAPHPLRSQSERIRDPNSQDLRLILRPSRLLRRIGLLNLVFFGLGVWVLWGDPDRARGALGAVIALYGCAAFAAVGAAVFAWSFVPTRLSHEGIEQVWPARRGAWLDLLDIRPLAKTYRSGVKLVFKDGTVIPVRADCQGYADFLSVMRVLHPNFGILATLAVVPRNA
ncbi:MAG: hypothetical protein AAF092_06150 [Pseudomonadota bacterium]